MTNQTDKELSAHDAARIIYNTPQPTAEQVGQVRLRLVRGQLKPGPGGSATTTSKAVADYMTAAAQARQYPRVAKKTGDSTQLSGLYRDLMRDYFLALVVRRKFGNRSAAFRHSVLIGQVAAIVLAFAGMAAIVKSTFLAEPHEHTLVRAYIKGQQGWVDIHECSSVPSTEGIVVRAQYSYRSGSSRKVVRTDRTFLVVGEQVQEITGGEDS